ncbi:MAG: caspase family protein [Hyphomicrobiales bacterium]|nr:caspase family protein [Hyphomicrobiales bacterium]
MTLHRPILRTLFAFAMIAATTLFSSGAARAELYGLVIGIDDYTGSANDLSGAVNDVVAIAEALRKAGATQVVALANDEANKDAIERALSALFGIAKANDVVVVSFSGHGGRAKGGDVMDRVFYLGGYTPRGPGTRERILDRELARWLNTAAEKSVRLILVADTGYATRLDRENDIGALRYRTAQFGELNPADDQLQLPQGDGPNTVDELATVLRLLAAPTDAGIAEITIGGKRHGALSWAFARAISGDADTNGDNAITATELTAYVSRAVALLTEYQQNPVIFVPGDVKKDGAEEVPLVRISPDEAKAEDEAKDTEQGASEAGVALPQIALFVDGDLPSGIADRPDVKIVNGAGIADLIWSPRSGIVNHRIGGMVADGIDADEISAVVDKWATLEVLKTAALANPVDLYAASGNRTYKPGDIAQTRMLGARQPALTLFNLTPDGRIEFLVPANAAEAAYDWTSGVFSERYKIGGSTFGADHLVAITSPAPLTDLHDKLKRMASTGDTAGLAAALAAETAKPDVAVGIAGIYSAAE